MLAATKCRKGSVNMADSGKWRHLCTTLCPESGSLGDDVVLCLEAPDIYFERFENDLAQRMIESSDEVTPWLALVDGLASRNLLWECDWKVVAPELSGCIESLRPCKELELDFEVFNQAMPVVMILCDRQRCCWRMQGLRWCNLISKATAIR